MNLKNLFGVLLKVMFDWRILVTLGSLFVFFLLASFISDFDTNQTKIGKKVKVKKEKKTNAEEKSNEENSNDDKDNGEKSAEKSA